MRIVCREDGGGEGAGRGWGETAFTSSASLLSCFVHSFSSDLGLVHFQVFSSVINHSVALY